MTAAHHLMRQRNIHHLPVVRDGRLVGIVSDRDLYRNEAVTHFDPDRVTVEEIMATDVIVMTPQTSLQFAAEIMDQRHAGSVVVVDHDRVVGIFTTSDALRALTEIVCRAAS